MADLTYASRLNTTVSEKLVDQGDGTYAPRVDAVVSSMPSDSRPAAVNITAQDVASATAAGQNGVSIVSGTPTAGSAQVFALNGRAAARVMVGGTWTGSLQFEGSIDGGVTYVAIPLRVVGTVYTTSQITGNGAFYGDVAGLTHFRVREIAAHTGTAAITSTFTGVGGPVQILNPVRLVDNGSGATATIKAASTVPVAADMALVVSQRPDEVHLGEVGGRTVKPTATFSRPADTTAYASGDLVANSTTAGSVVPLSWSVARVTAGSGMIRRARFRKTNTVLTNASFRLHLYTSAPTPSNGDNGVWLTDQSATYLGAIDVTFAKAFTDGCAENGVPNTGSEINFALASGQTIYGLLEARAAYTPTSGETFTVDLEVLQN